LQFWSISEEDDKAYGQTSFEWALDQGLVPDPESAPTQESRDQPDRT
jgi:hypothetical protein